MDERMVLERVAAGDLGVDEAARLLDDLAAGDDSGTEWVDSERRGAEDPDEVRARMKAGRDAIRQQRREFRSQAREEARARRGPGRTRRLDPDTLIALAGLGVDADWISAVCDAGVEFAGETLVGLAGVGVTPEWIRAVREAGVQALDGETLVGLAGVGVTPEWIRGLRDAGVDRLDGETLVALAGSGVTAEWVANIRDLGLQLDGEALAGLATADWLQRVNRKYRENVEKADDDADPNDHEDDSDR